MKHPLTLSIQGMHCDACVRRVTNALQAVEGVEPGTVKIGSAQLSFDPEKATPEHIADAINHIGFQGTVNQ